MIEQQAFGECTNLKTLSISYGVRGIFSGAFENCSGLDTIFIPRSVVLLYDDIFKGCSLTIEGFHASTAETYAHQYGIAFRGIDAVTFSLENQTVKANDEVALLFSLSSGTFAEIQLGFPQKEVPVKLVGISIDSTKIVEAGENEFLPLFSWSCGENFPEAGGLFSLHFKVNTAVPGDISVRPQILELLVKQDDGTFVDMSDCARIEGGTLTIPHEHSFSTYWQADETTHFHVCSCGERTDVEAHSFSWIVDVEPTETAQGVKHEECSICGYRRNENTPIDRLPHTHVFSQAWTSDETTHYHVCSCGERADVEAHSFSWIVDVEPTETAQGVKHEECSICGYRRNENTPIPKTECEHALVYVDAKAATYLEAGNIAYWICGKCNRCFADVNAIREIPYEETQIPPLDIVWGDVNGDGAVDTADAVLVLQRAANLIGDADLNMIAADVNGDGAIDTADAVLILQKAAKLIERFPTDK